MQIKRKKEKPTYSTYQLLKGSSSVLIKCGKVNILLCRTQTDSLGIALNSLFIFSCFKIFVAFVLGCLGSIKRVLKYKRTIMKHLSTRSNRFRSQWLHDTLKKKMEGQNGCHNASHSYLHLHGRQESLIGLPNQRFYKSLTWKTHFPPQKAVLL